MDIALVYNPATGGCDVAFNGTDFELDSTPASAMLFSLLGNRRANPDDTVPTQVTTPLAPQSFTARGGYPGDALDPTGQLVGSRLSLLQRALANEQTRIDAQNYVVEALTWMETVRGLAVQIAVRWFAPGILAYRAVAGSTVVQLNRAIGG